MPASTSSDCSCNRYRPSLHSTAMSATSRTLRRRATSTCNALPGSAGTCRHRPSIKRSARDPGRGRRRQRGQQHPLLSCRRYVAPGDHQRAQHADADRCHRRMLRPPRRAFPAAQPTRNRRPASSGHAPRRTDHDLDHRRDERPDRPHRRRVGAMRRDLHHRVRVAHRRCHHSPPGPRRRRARHVAARRRYRPRHADRPRPRPRRRRLGHRRHTRHGGHGAPAATPASRSTSATPLR